MKEALKLALEALRMADELFRGHGVDFKEYGLEFDRDIQVKYKDVITAIKGALAQPEQEPVACKHQQQCLNGLQCFCTTPPKEQQSCDKRPWGKPWVSLTDDEILAIGKELGLKCRLGGNQNIDFDYARAIDAKLKEKNT